MFNKQLKANIKEIDVKIGQLMKELSVEVEDNKKMEIVDRMEELTNLRCKLAESKVKESYSKEILTGAIGLATTVIVLKHEKTDVITSKAFGLAGKLFRRAD